jgi:GT2 family glycosyltransferase
MELTVVVLNWNAAKDTVNCVQQIVAWQHLNPAILVVDNASSDDSLKIIARECPTIQLISNAENLGFAGGTNRGISEALSVGNAPILLLNNDAFINEGDVIRLLETLEKNDKIGFIGPLLYDADKEDRLLSAGGKNPIKHHHTRILTLTPGEPVRSVEYVSGTAVIIRAEVFRRVGLLDEDYFFSTELADLCMRAREGGYRSAIDTRARAYHTISRSSGLRNTLYVYYIIRNRFIFIRNSPYRLKILFYIFWTTYSLMLSFKLYVSGKLATAQAVRIGLTDGLQGRYGGQNERVLSICSKSTRPANPY